MTRWRTLAMAAWAWGALSAPADADAWDWGDGVAAIEDAEMEELRGGFEVGGIEFGFAAVVTSTLNGVPVMTTQLTLTESGTTVVEQTLGALGQTLGSLTPEQLAALGLAALTGFEGIVVNGQSGVTAFVHNINDGTLQNILVNTDSGQDIEQHIDITLTLPGFETIQQQMMLERFGMQVSEDLRAMSVGLPD